MSWLDQNNGNLPAAGGWQDHLVVVNTFTGQTLVDTYVNQNTGSLPIGSTTARFFTFNLPEGLLGAGGIQATVTTDAFNSVAEDNDTGTAETNNAATTVSYTNSISYPDLEVQNLQWQWNGNAGIAGPVTITWSDHNSGQGVAGSWVDHIQVVNQLTGHTIVDALVPGNYQNLFAGGSSSQAYNFTLPAGFEGAGPLQVTVTTDANNNLYEYDFYDYLAGYGELNNDATLNVFSSPADTGDLSLTNLSFAPASTLQSGGLVTLQWNDVRSTTPITTSYSDHIVIINQSTGQTLVDTVQDFTCGLGNAYSSPRFLNFQLPDGYLGTGQLLATVTVDASNTVPEFNFSGSQEFNNVASIQGYSNLANYADLTVTGINAITPPAAGAQVLLQWNDLNLGQSVNAAAWSDHIVVTNALSGQVLFDTTKNYTAAPLYSGSSQFHFLSINLPSGPASGGQLIVTITTDSGNSLYEWNYSETAEANNTATYTLNSTFTPPDLQIQNVFIEAPSGYQPGATVTVHWTDNNTGTGPASGTWFDSIVLSTPSNILTNGFTAGSNLAPSAFKQQSYSYTLPNNYVPGTQLQVSLATDIYSSIAEYNATATGEQNNTYATAVNRTNYTDLSLGSVPPPSFTAGGDLLLQWFDFVNGSMPASAWHDRITVVNTTTGQTLLDTTQAANTQTQGQYYIWTVPNDGTANGNLAVVIQVDANNEVAEYGEYSFGQNGEGNNTLVMYPYQQAQQTPDLIIAQSSLAPGSVMQSGTAVTLQWQDYNAGTIPTLGSWNDRVTITNKSTGQTIIDQVLPFNYGSILPGVGVPRSLTFTMPDGVAGAGDMDIRITVDSGNSIFEGSPNSQAELNNTNDNTAFSQFANYPDLAVSGLTILGNTLLRTGQDVTINWLDFNNGNATVPYSKFVDRVTVTNLVTGETIVDTVLDPNPVSIQPGNALQRYFQFRLPDGWLAASQYSISVTTDSTNAMFELPGAGGGETNNTETITTYAQLSPSPDLQVTDLMVANTSPVYSGGPMTITWNDRNLGSGAAATGWNDRLQVVNMYTGQVLVDTNLVISGGLDAGASTPNSYSFTLPSGLLGAGYLRVIVTTDVNHNVAEDQDYSSESNNTTILNPDILVNVGAPDIGVIQGYYGLGSVWQPGGTVTVYWYDYNAGTFPLTGTWTDLLSVTNIDTGQFVASFSTINTASSMIYGVIVNSVTVTLPNDATALGNLRFTVVADVNNDIPELSLYGSGEFNNTISFDHLSAIAGDANGDGIVNGQDIAMVASNWLTNGPPGDVNFDNIVNGQDIALIASNWLNTFAPGSSAGAAALAATDASDQPSDPSSDALALNVGHSAAVTDVTIDAPVLIAAVTAPQVAPVVVSETSASVALTVATIASSAANGSEFAPTVAVATIATPPFQALAVRTSNASQIVEDQPSVYLNSGQVVRSTLVNQAFADDGDESSEAIRSIKPRAWATLKENGQTKRLNVAERAAAVAHEAAEIDSDLIELLATNQHKSVG